MKESGMFLADERVIPLLPRLLGKIFFEAKKYVKHSSLRIIAHIFINSGNRYP